MLCYTIASYVSEDPCRKGLSLYLMDVIDYLASDNYVIVNRSLMKTIGVTESIVLGELASECKYWKNARKLQDGEWFFSTDDNLEERLPFSKPTIRRTIESLKELGIVETKLMGVPAKRFFRLIKSEILGCSNFSNLGYKKMTTHKNTEEEHESERENPEEKAPQDDDSGKLTVRMKPTTLRQQLALIFRATDKTKTRSLSAIRKLQEQFDDDSIILDAARKMKRRGEITFKDGTTWKADYFWFVNPDKTEAVVRGIIHVMKNDLTEEEVDPRKQKLDAWIVEHGYDLNDPMLIVQLQRDKDYLEYMWRIDNGEE